jgi:YggT family protein
MILFQIITFLLDVAASLLGGACLLRLYMQYQRVSFYNPVGRFVFALTDWLVLPLRRLLPTAMVAMGGWDLSSLLAAYAVQLLKFALLWLLAGATVSGIWIPVLAVFGLLATGISSLSGLVLVYAILSWVPVSSALGSVVERLCEPLLTPLRRAIPLVGGVDLSPLALLVLLQVAAMLLGAVQAEVLS